MYIYKPLFCLVFLLLFSNFFSSHLFGSIVQACVRACVRACLLACVRVCLFRITFSLRSERFMAFSRELLCFWCSFVSQTPFVSAVTPKGQTEQNKELFCWTSLRRDASCECQCEQSVFLFLTIKFDWNFNNFSVLFRFSVFLAASLSPPKLFLIYAVRFIWRQKKKIEKVLLNFFDIIISFDYDKWKSYITESKYWTKF